MADLKISQLTAQATFGTISDLLVIVNSGVTKKITYENLFNSIPDNVFRIARNGISSAGIVFDLSAIPVLTQRTLSVIDASGTLMLTNGTLISGAKILIGSDATGDIYYNGGAGTITKLSAGAAGKFLMYNGVGAAPIVSTLVLPNAVSANNVLYATSANTIGSSANLTYASSTLKSINSAGACFLAETNQSSTSLTSTFGCFNSHNTNTTTGSYTEYQFYNGGTQRAIVFSRNTGVSTYGVWGVAVLTNSSTGLEHFVLTGQSASNDILANLRGMFYIGDATTTPTAFLHIKAGTTGAAQIRLTAGVAPASPNDGDIYYIDTNDRFMVRKNTLDSEILSASAVTTEALTSDTSLTITYNGITYKLLAKV